MSTIDLPELTTESYDEDPEVQIHAITQMQGCLKSLNLGFWPAA